MREIPAFPVPQAPRQGWHGMGAYDGMTLRDYFAAKAMAAALVNASAGSAEQVPQMMELVAKAAYMAADAMLKARGAE
jgi:hypothetical protein